MTGLTAHVMHTKVYLWHQISFYWVVCMCNATAVNITYCTFNKDLWKTTSCTAFGFCPM